MRPNMNTTPMMDPQMMREAMRNMGAGGPVPQQFQNMGAGGPVPQALQGMPTATNSSAGMDPRMMMLMSQFGNMMRGSQKPRQPNPQHQAAVQSMMQRAMMGRNRGV